MSLTNIWNNTKEHFLFQKMATAIRTGPGSSLSFSTSTSFPLSKKTLFLCCIFNKEMSGVRRIMSFLSYTCLLMGRSQDLPHRHFLVEMLPMADITHIPMGDKGPQGPVVGSLWGPDWDSHKGMCLKVYGGWSMASGWDV